MALYTEQMRLLQHEKTFTAEGIIEHVKYAHVIERDGVEISNVPHRIVINRNTLSATHSMPDGTVKVTSEIMMEVDV